MMSIATIFAQFTDVRALLLHLDNPVISGLSAELPAVLLDLSILPYIPLIKIVN